MNADIVSIGLKLDGLQQVLAGLQSVQKGADQTAQRVSGLTKAATAYAGAATAISAASIKAYDSFARFEIGARSLLGTLEGSRFADAIQKMAVPSAFSAEQLRLGGQGLIATGMDGARAERVLGAFSNIAAAGGASNQEFSRSLLALRQIQAKGTVRAEEINRQLADSLPLLAASIRDHTGRNPIGMKSADFMDALVAVGEGRFGGAQSRLAAKSPLIALQNAWEGVMNAMIPTGERLAEILGVLVAILAPITDAWTALNKAFKGLPGLIVVFALLRGAIASMLKALRLQIAGVWQITAAQARQLTTIELVNGALLIMAQRLGMASAAGGAGNAAGAAQGGAAAMNLIRGGGIIAFLSKLKIGNLGAALKSLGGLAKLVKFAGRISWILTLVFLAFDVVPKLLTNLGKIFGRIGEHLSDLWAQVADSPFGQALTAIWDFINMLWDGLVSILALDWLVDLMGIEDQADQGNAGKVRDALGNSANRAIRRGDAEVWWQSRLADMR